MTDEHRLSLFPSSSKVFSGDGDENRFQRFGELNFFHEVTVDSRRASVLRKEEKEKTRNQKCLICEENGLKTNRREIESPDPETFIEKPRIFDLFSPSSSRVSESCTGRM